MLRDSLATIAVIVAFGLSGCVQEKQQGTSQNGNSSGGSGGSGSSSRSGFFFCDTRDLDRDSSKNLANLFSDFNKSFVAKASSNSSTLYTIPVNFHVIMKDDSAEGGDVPDESLAEQVDILNRAYSGEIGGVGTPYRFELAGINRVVNEKWHSFAPGAPEETEVKKALRVGDAKTLNVFIMDILVPKGGTGKILGYSTFPFVYKMQPALDGIMLHYRAVPGSDLDHYNTGHVLVHESGHWLGLLHTFTGACDGLFTDLVSDTPREKTPTRGNYCPTNLDSCPSNPGLDPIHNHMTYTGDECRTEFTSGQVSFMKFNTMIFRGLK